MKNVARAVEAVPETQAAPDARRDDLGVIEGVVRDERGVAVGEGFVRLFGAIESSAPIDLEGRYRLEEPVGTIGFVKADVPDHVTAPEVKTVEFGTEPLARDLEVLRLWVVTGRLVATDGTPVTRARIEIENAPFGEPVDGNTGPGEDGTFRHRLSPPIDLSRGLPVRLPVFENGPLALRVEPEGKIDAVVPLDADRLRAEAFLDVGDIVVRDGCEVIVIVRDPASAPIEGAALTFRQRGEGELMRTGTTDAAGRCRLGGLDPGTYALTAREPAHLPVIVPTVTVFASAGAGPDEILVVMEKGVSIEGVVIDESGDPVEGARVSVEAVMSSGGDGGRLGSITEVKSAHTVADGSFRIDGLPGDYLERHAKLVAASEAAGRAAPPAPFEVRVTAPGPPPLAGEARGVEPGEPVTIVARPRR